MKRRYWIGWALGLLPAAAPTGRSADAVVEFYRTQPDAEQYLLHETSLYELQRSIDDKFGRDRDFWRRAAEKFAENAEAVRLCGERERNYEIWQEREGKWLEEDVGSRMEPGDRVFHYEWRNDEWGRLILAPDGRIKWRTTDGGGGWLVPEFQKIADARWKQDTEAVRRTIGERATELEADTAALFLDKRPDTAGHSLHATSVRGMRVYLIQMRYVSPCPPASKKWIAENIADLPGFLEFAKAEETALLEWLAPRKTIVDQIEAEADPTDRLYWDVSDDGEHRRAGLLWLRRDGSVRREWPDFGEAVEKGVSP